jgi:hypothetical protein
MIFLSGINLLSFFALSFPLSRLLTSILTPPSNATSCHQDSRIVEPDDETFLCLFDFFWDYYFTTSISFFSMSTPYIPAYCRLLALSSLWNKVLLPMK